MDISSYVELLFRPATRKQKPKQPQSTPIKPDKIVWRFDRTKTNPRYSNNDPQVFLEAPN